MLARLRKYFSWIIIGAYFLVYFFGSLQTAQAAIPVTITSPTSGSVIRSSTVIITGTTAPNYTLYLSLDGRPAVATPANSFGNWSQTFTQLRSGNHSLTATVTGGPFAYFTNNGLIAGGSLTNTVSVVDASTNLRVNTAQSGTSPGGVALSADGTKLYVSNFTDSTISIINTANDQNIGTIPVGPAGSSVVTGLVINPANSNYAYVGYFDIAGSNGYIKIINLATNSVVGTSAALQKANTVGNPSPFGLSITPNGSKLLVANLIDSSVGIMNITGGGSIVTELAFPLSPVSIVSGPFSGDQIVYAGINPAGTKAYIGHIASSPTEDDIYVLDLGTNSLCTATGVPSASCVGATYPITDASFSFPLFARPAPDGSKIYASNVGSTSSPTPGTISVISPVTDSVTSTTSAGIGFNPTSIGYLSNYPNPGDLRAYVANIGSNNVSVINVASNTVIGSISNVPNPLTLGDFVGQRVTNQTIDFSNGSGLGFSFEIPVGFGFNENPIIRNALPENVLPNLREVPSSVGGSLLDQFVQALKNTPVVVAYSFPYLLFGLLAILLLILIWQTRQEIAKIYALRKTLEKERLIAQEKDDFLAISSHYLRTPTAIITSGIEELRRLGKGASTTIVGLSASSIVISNRVRRLTEDVNQNIFLKDIEEPDIKHETIQAFSSPYFFLPILSVGLLAILTNVLFVSIGKISLSIINFLTQIMIFIVIAAFIYVFFRRRYLQRQQRENYEKTVNYQRVLDNARNDFIEATKNDLELEVNKMKNIISTSTGKGELKNIANGVRRLDSMLAKFAIVAQIESGQVKRFKQQIDVNLVINSIIGKHESAIKKKQLKIKIAGEKPLINQDLSKLTFVLDSLIDNAIKFNKLAGSIIISSNMKGEIVTISIEDSGIGIKKSDLAHIFKPFSKIGSALEFNYEGMGISMFINKIIMGYLGGDILVESVQGKGTKTTIAFGNLTQKETISAINWNQAPTFNK